MSKRRNQTRHQQRKASPLTAALKPSRAYTFLPLPKAAAVARVLTRNNISTRTKREVKRNVVRAIQHRMVSPINTRREVRHIGHLATAVAAPLVYRDVHNCNLEWRKLLSWRSKQGPGRKRTRRELKNSRRFFLSRDC